MKVPYITYDKKADAAYVYLHGKKDLRVASTVRIGADDILHDFDEEGHLIGVEILNASEMLRLDELNVVEI